ncbi:MAG TPA: glycosyltransferase [Bryobacteraceae bacterium]|nr:glycosyltransferase [Bryobacteraceae bacterium]
MKEKIKVAFASGPEELNRELVERMTALFPELPLYVVSEFPPESGRWIPYHVSRGFLENLARCRAAWRGKQVRLAGVLLAPQMPYRRMRLIALLVSPVGFLAFNENFGSFMLRPRNLGTIVRHLTWRARNFFRWQFRPGGRYYTLLWKLVRPREWRVPVLYRAARVAGWIARLMKSAPASTRSAAAPVDLAPAGISVVIPSRDGKDLLAAALPAVERELAGIPSEIIVVDNGSSDGSASAFPHVVFEISSTPLSFARAVNRGIRRARYSHVCLLNNDMRVEPGFFRALLDAFDRVPDLFCSTAQIFLPPGARREETGKAVMARNSPTDFPVRCDLPLAGENDTYVLYGSGGCSLYDAAKLLALGGVREIYEPAYVEDLDLGYRGWARGWPTVFVSAALVEHRHRATTSRYYSEAELAQVLEVNYLRFLTSAVSNARLFATLWFDAVWRLRVLKAGDALAFAVRAPMLTPPPTLPALAEAEFLALTGGGVTVFPGRRPGGKPVALIVSPYAPFPLSHGGAVRMFNLMRRAAAEYDLVLVCFATQPDTPAAELLGICVEVVLVKMTGSHSRPASDRPEVVEEFDSPAFHAALRQTTRKWRPSLAQLEFTQMAQYAADCEPAPTLLVEHDITFDLYEQLLRIDDDWEMRRQLERWKRFETAAWRNVNCVVTMSEKDRRMAEGARLAVALGNGVDVDRFRPAPAGAAPNTLLFIGSFAHLPNLLALEFFLKEVWTLLEDVEPTLHVIAGMRHEYFLEFYKDRAAVDLNLPRVKVDGFVADVRPAYEQAAIVIAPLKASAGTNIKILEAMAMGKAIVSTPAGVNGLELENGKDVVIAGSAPAMAAAIRALIENPPRRQALERNARRKAEQRFDWNEIARRQSRLWNLIRGGG